MLIPNNFLKNIYHIGCANSLHSIKNSGLIAGGENSSKERQTVCFTAVNPMDKEHKDPYKLDLTQPRLAWYKQKTWKRHQDTVYWVDIQLAQRKGLKFHQTRSNAIILYDTLPAYCILKVVVMKAEEITYKKYMCHLDHHRKFPSKIIGRVIWILMLQAAVKTSSESNLNPIPNYQVQGDLLQNRVKKPWNVPSLIATFLIKRNMIMSQIQRVRGDPYVDTNPQNVAC